MNLFQIFGKRTNIVAAVMASFILSPVSANEPVERDTLFFTTPPSASEISDHIFPKRVLTRSMFDEETANEPSKSVGMPVLFHFGKTTLVEASKPFLDSVGQVLQQAEYETEILVIEGHTDSVGTDYNNFKLSELRALAVKEYLVEKYSIEPLRLFVEGKGERELFDKSNPKAGENRRVEFLRHPM